jgi:transposase
MPFLDGRPLFPPPVFPSRHFQIAVIWKWLSILGAQRGFVLLPRRWVVERSFAWAARFHCLARDYERLAKTLAAFHFLAFACLMLANLFRLLAQS